MLAKDGVVLFELEAVRRTLRDREGERDKLAEAIGQVAGSLQKHEEEFQGLKDMLSEKESEASARAAELEAQRAKALVLWRTGAADDARALLEQLTAHKRPRNDLFWFLGAICAEQGDTKAAKAALTRFLDKAGKKAAYRGEAEALLAKQ